MFLERLQKYASKHMSEGSKLNVTIDTNLVVSGTISSNTTPSRLLLSWIQGQFNWILTDEIYEEIKDVLNRDYIKDAYLNEAQISDILNNLSVGAEFVTSIDVSLLPIRSRDAKDDKFLACAIAGTCEYLVTGDKDLLVLNGKPELGNLQIVTASEFLSREDVLMKEVSR